ncbi:MAG: Gp15 family bacteriophage protein [Ruthenibacterium sp.]
MQNLFCPLPRYVVIQQKKYELNTDYRTALRILAAFEDAELADLEKQGIMLKLLYKTVPPDEAQAVRLAQLFLNCGEAQTETDDTPPLYSFTADAPLIYAALRKSHGVDVIAEEMHWYRFVALFCDISEDSFFARLLYLRRAAMEGKLTPEEKRLAIALKNYMRVPQSATPEETEFMRLYKMPQKEE